MAPIICIVAIFHCPKLKSNFPPSTSYHNSWEKKIHRRKKLSNIWPLVGSKDKGVSNLLVQRTLSVAFLFVVFEISISSLRSIPRESESYNLESEKEGYKIR